MVLDMLNASLFGYAIINMYDWFSQNQLKYKVTHVYLYSFLVTCLLIFMLKRIEYYIQC